MDQHRGCHSDLDHTYGPRSAYKTELEEDFRELPENKTLICRRLHEERHAREPFPAKPDVEFMMMAVRRYRGSDIAAD